MPGQRGLELLRHGLGAGADVGDGELDRFGEQRAEELDPLLGAEGTKQRPLQEKPRGSRSGRDRSTGERSCARGRRNRETYSRPPG